MGLREKVALGLIAIVIQATWTVCLPQSYRNPFDRYAKSRAKKILNNPQLYGQSTQNVDQQDFPEVDFPTCSSPIGLHYSVNQNADEICPIKSSTDKFISNLKKEARKKRKNEKLKNQLLELDSAKDHRRTANEQISPSFLNQMAFPEVEYPNKIEDTWGPKYFNTLPYNTDDPHYKFSDFNKDHLRSTPTRQITKDNDALTKSPHLKKNKEILGVVKQKNTTASYDTEKDQETVRKNASSRDSRIENKSKKNKKLNGATTPQSQTPMISTKQKKLRKLLSQKRPNGNKKVPLKLSPEENLSEKVSSGNISLLCPKDEGGINNNSSLFCSNNIIKNLTREQLAFNSINQTILATKDIEDCHHNICDIEILEPTNISQHTEKAELNQYIDNNDDKNKNSVRDDYISSNALKEDNNSPDKIILSLFNEDTPDKIHDDNISNISLKDGEQQNLFESESPKTEVIQKDTEHKIIETATNSSVNNVLELPTNLIITQDSSDSKEIEVIPSLGYIHKDISQTSISNTTAEGIADEIVTTTEAVDNTDTLVTDAPFSTFDLITDMLTYTTPAEEIVDTPIYTAIDVEYIVTKPPDYSSEVPDTSLEPLPEKVTDTSISTTSNEITDANTHTFEEYTTDNKTEDIPNNSDSVTWPINIIDPSNYSSAEIRDFAEKVLAEVGPVPEFEPVNTFIADHTYDILPLLYPSVQPTEFDVPLSNDKAIYSNNSLKSGNNTTADDLIDKDNEDNYFSTKVRPIADIAFSPEISNLSEYISTLTSTEVNDLIELVNNSNYSKPFPTELDNLVEEILNELNPLLDEYFEPDNLTSLLVLPTGSFLKEYNMDPNAEIQDFTNLVSKEELENYCPVSEIDQCMPIEKDKHDTNYTIMDFLNGTATFDNNDEGYKSISTEAMQDSDSMEDSDILSGIQQNVADRLPDRELILDDDKLSTVPEEQAKYHFDELHYNNISEYNDSSEENIGQFLDADKLKDIVAEAHDKQPKHLSEISPLLDEFELAHDYGTDEFSDEFDTQTTVSDDDT